MDRNRIWKKSSSLAAATSALVMFCTTGALADEESSSTKTAPATQSVTVEAPKEPASTTKTTAAPYVATDHASEKSIEHRPNGPLLKLGTTALVLGYGGSVVAGAVSDRDEDRKLFIPVVGPWLDLANRDCGGRCGGGEDVAKAMIVTSGVVQGAGVLMALGSLIIPETTTVSEHSTTAKVEKPTVRVTPLSFAAGAGIGAVGRF